MKRITTFVCAAVWVMAAAGLLAQEMAPEVSVFFQNTHAFSVNGDVMMNIPQPLEPSVFLSVSTGDYNVELALDMEFASPETYIYTVPFLRTDQGTSYAAHKTPPLTMYEPGYYFFERPSVVAAPGLYLARSVDQPLIPAQDDSAQQTVDIILRFESPLDPAIETITLSPMADIWWPRNVWETLVSRNTPPGWTAAPYVEFWYIDADDVEIGRDYHFQAVIQCDKQSSALGAPVYHKSCVFLQYTDAGAATMVSDSTSLDLTNAAGETFSISSPQPVNWLGTINENSLHVFLEPVDLRLNGSSPEIHEILVVRGLEVDDSGLAPSHFFMVEAEGNNVVSGELITPTGQVWPLEVEGDAGGVCAELELEYLTYSDLVALGVTHGSYEIIFRGPYGDTVSTHVPIICDMPAQTPQIMLPDPAERAAKAPLTFAWAPVTDPAVDLVAVICEDEFADEENPVFLTPAATSYTVHRIPADTILWTEVAFALTRSGVTAESIPWSYYGVNMRAYCLASAPLPGDLDGDDAVDLLDLAIFVGDWLDPVCTEAPGACRGDISDDGAVNLRDFAFFGPDWLRGTAPQSASH